MAHGACDGVHVNWGSYHVSPLGESSDIDLLMAGRLLMGDATYANVYGNAVTGDLTRSMRASGSGAAGAWGGVEV